MNNYMIDITISFLTLFLSVYLHLVFHHIFCSLSEGFSTHTPALFLVYIMPIKYNIPYYEHYHKHKPGNWMTMRVKQILYQVQYHKTIQYSATVIHLMITGVPLLEYIS